WEGAVKAWNKIGVATPELVVDRAEANEAAHAPLARRDDTVEPHHLRRKLQPRRGRMETEIEIRDRAPARRTQTTCQCAARRLLHQLNPIRLKYPPAIPNCQWVEGVRGSDQGKLY